jgi:hypothetical protein
MDDAEDAQVVESVDVRPGANKGSVTLTPGAFASRIALWPGSIRRAFWD